MNKNRRIKSVRVFDNSIYDMAIMGVTADNRAVYDYENMLDITYLHMKEKDAVVINEQIIKGLVDAVIESISGDYGAPIIVYSVDFLEETETDNESDSV